MLTPQGVAELAKRHRAAEGARPRGRLHHPQAPRGARARRPHLGPAPGPRGRRASTRGDARGSTARGAAGRDRPDACSASRRRRTRRAARSCRTDVEGHRPARRPPRTPLLELATSTPAARGGELGIEDVSLKVRLGEILGVAGVDGNGQRALAEAIAGQRRRVGRRRSASGAPIARLAVAQREKLGLRYVTDDRLGEGMVAGAPGRHQPRAQAHRPGAVLAARPHPARATVERNARRAARPSTTSARRSGRRAPARSRAATSRRSCSRASSALDPGWWSSTSRPTASTEDDADRARRASGSWRTTAARARDLDRPRRAARPLRPHRRALPRPADRAWSRTAPAREQASAADGGPGLRSRPPHEP